MARRNPSNGGTPLIRIAYVVVILVATLSDLDLDRDLRDIDSRLERMLMPDWSRRAMVDGVRNVVLFAGWGLVWILTVRGSLRWNHLRGALLTGAALSVAVECVQLFSESRVASVLDIATNSGGSLLGAAVVIGVVGALRRPATDRSLIGLPLPVMAMTYGCAVLGEALVPLFRQEERVAITGGVFARILAGLADFEISTLREVMVTDVLLFLPAGFLVTAALFETGVGARAAAWTASLVAIPLLAVAEIAHGALRIQVHGGAASSHAAAVLIGAVVASVSLPWLLRHYRLQERALSFGVAYALLLVFWALRPFDFDLRVGNVLSELRSDWWVPLRFISERPDLFSVIDVLNNFLLYLPLGAILCVWRPRQGSHWWGLALGVAYTLLLEGAQLIVASRALDITDAVVQVVAVAVGWAVTDRAGLTPRPHGDASRAESVDRYRALRHDTSLDQTR